METVVGQLEIVVRGRNVVVPDHFRDHVAEKMTKYERYDSKIHRVDVELHHEKNPRQNDSCQHIEITCRTRGPVVRSEACAEDFYKALDIAGDRLERRLRQAADRRRIHHGRRAPQSLAELRPTRRRRIAATEARRAEDEIEDGPGRIVREKEHTAEPMTVDQALLEMELVGHDFFLFKDVETGARAWSTAGTPTTTASSGWPDTAVRRRRRRRVADERRTRPRRRSCRRRWPGVQEHARGDEAGGSRRPLRGDVAGLGAQFEPGSPAASKAQGATSRSARVV